MNNDKKCIEKITSTLSDKAILSLCMLDKQINLDPEQENNAVMAKMISESEILTLIFAFAKNNQKGRLGNWNADQLNSNEVMKILGISKRTLVEWRKTGLLPCTVFRKKCFYPVASLVKILEENYQRKNTTG